MSKNGRFPFRAGAGGFCLSLFGVVGCGIGMGWYTLIGLVAYFSRAVIAKASCVSLLNR
jgi:hypothetical protein